MSTQEILVFPTFGFCFVQFENKTGPIRFIVLSVFFFCGLSHWTTGISLGKIKKKIFGSPSSPNIDYTRWVPSNLPPIPNNEIPQCRFCTRYLAAAAAVAPLVDPAVLVRSCSLGGRYTLTLAKYGCFRPCLAEIRLLGS